MIKKLKYYRLPELVHIAMFKVAYKLELKVYEYRLRLFPKKWSSVVSHKAIDYNSFYGFYANCAKDIDCIVSEADELLQGNIYLFGTHYKIDTVHGWLNDPVTGRLWDKNVFFVVAPANKQGLADVKYVLELNKFNHLVRTALAYYYTHDEKYIQFIIDSIDGYRETINPYYSIVQRIIMDMSFRVINLIQIILLCKDDEDFQKRIVPKINGIIYDQVKAIEHFHTARWFKTGNGANHTIGEMIGLILGQLWLQYNGIANYNNRYKKEYSYLVEVLNRTIASSGAYLEQSGNYSRLVAEFLVMFDFMKGIMGQEGYYKAYEEAHYRGRLLQYLRDISYNDFVPNFGDNDDARVLTAFREHGEQIEYFLKNIKPSYCPEAYLDGSQWQFCSQDEKDVHLFVRVGKFAFFREGASIHAHNDMLAILMGIKGHPVFVDKGIRYYNSGSEIRKKYSQIAAHNTICIEGKEMTNLESGVCFHYPICKYAEEDVHDSVVFSGYLNYGTVEHKRIITYHGGRIELEDVVRVINTNEVKGSIHYLLNQNIKANKYGEDVILSMPCGSIISLRIKGIDSLELVPSDYSPSYGQSVSTMMLIGHFRLKSELRIITSITI